jgi:hypothetical protein
MAARYLCARCVSISDGIAVSTISLARPSATANAGVLTFNGTPLADPAAAGSGNVTTAQVRDCTGNLMISGLTIGIPGSTADAVIDNGAGRSGSR